MTTPLIANCQMYIQAHLTFKLSYHDDVSMSNAQGMLIYVISLFLTVGRFGVAIFIKSSKLSNVYIFDSIVLSCKALHNVSFLYSTIL